MGGANFVVKFLRDEVLERVAQVVPLVEAAGLTPAQFAVAWVLRNPNVASAIVGASRPEQLVENVAAVDVVLDDDLVAAVEAILDPVVERDAARTAQSSPITRP
jgi:aryl-alcohol dehydrogenase-like predicted oxidoreductase